MQGPLPPNQGTDDYEILFNAIGPTDSSMLGKFLCLAGDQNGDGYDDILVYCEYPPETRLYFGGNPMNTIPDLVFNIPPNCAGFGPYPNTISDLNADDYEDIVIRYGYGNNYEEVFVYYGGEVLDTIPDVILASDEGSFTGYENFGNSISLGDINGDGADDLAVGAPNYDVSMMSGKLFFYNGGDYFDSIPDYTITSGYNNFGDNFPGNISICNDINNDRYNDILCNSGWGADGKCYLFFGDVQLDSIPDWNYEGGILGGTLLKDIIINELFYCAKIPQFIIRDNPIQKFAFNC